MSHEPADTDDLAGAGGEIDVTHHAGGKTFDADANRAGCRDGARREQVAGLAADHQAHQAFAVDAEQRLVGGDQAILQHRDVRAERLHLVEAVGNIEKCSAAISQRLDQAGKNAGFVRGER